MGQEQQLCPRKVYNNVSSTYQQGHCNESSEQQHVVEGATTDSAVNAAGKGLTDEQGLLQAHPRQLLCTDNFKVPGVQLSSPTTALPQEDTNTASSHDGMLPLAAQAAAAAAPKANAFLPTSFDSPLPARNISSKFGDRPPKRAPMTPLEAYGEYEASDISVVVSFDKTSTIEEMADGWHLFLHRLFPAGQHIRSREAKRRRKLGISNGLCGQPGALRTS